MTLKRNEKRRSIYQSALVEVHWKTNLISSGGELTPRWNVKWFYFAGSFI